MGLIQGFRLIDYIEGESITYLLCKDGMVDYNPSRKWQFEKENPTDPTDTWQLGKYYLDTFSCKVPSSPEEVAALIDFIDDATELRIEFNHGKDDAGDWITKQFIITKTKKLPEVPDNLHEFREFTKFNLESRYETYPSAIGEGDILEDEEIVV